MRTVLVIGLTVADKWIQGKYPRYCLTNFQSNINEWESCIRTTSNSKKNIQYHLWTKQLPFLQDNTGSSHQFLSHPSHRGGPSQHLYLQAFLESGMDLYIRLHKLHCMTKEKGKLTEKSQVKTAMCSAQNQPCVTMVQDLWTILDTDQIGWMILQFNW